MNKRIRPLFLSIACFAGGAIPLLQSATVELDLAQALARAPQANFQILLSDEALVAQQEAVRVSRSGLMPQVSLEASQSRMQSPVIDSFSSSFPGVPNRFFNNRFDAVLRARLSLLDTRTWDDLKISRLSLRATRFQIENTVQEILQQIAISYFTHWRNKRRLDVIDANLERDRLLLQIANDQQDAGVATALDVTRAEVSLATNELSRLQQETTLLDSILRLKRILNIPMGTDLVLKEEPFEIEEMLLGFSPDGFTKVLANRGDYQQLQTEVERESLARRATRRDRLPSLELTGDWGVAAETWSDDMQEQWSIRLGLSMPIFEGFRLDAEERLAASALRSRELELKDLTGAIEADYRLVLQRLQSSAQQVAVARRAVSLNEREFELSRIRFEEGVADNSDVVSAQATLADAEDTLVEAEYQYIQARINLARIEGDVRSILD